MTQLWFLYHIPKTGGQTLRDAVARQLIHGVEYIHMGRWDRTRALNDDDLAALDRDARDRIRVISGHPLHRSAQRHFPGRVLEELVIIRDPAERIVSRYNFTMAMRAVQGDADIPFEEWLDKERRDASTKFLAKRLGVQGARDVLSSVLRELGSMNVLLTENLDESVPEVLGALGLHPEPQERSNVSGQHFPARKVLTADLRRRLRDENPMDCQLHDVAARLEAGTRERLRTARSGNSIA